MPGGEEWGVGFSPLVLSASSEPCYFLCIVCPNKMSPDESSRVDVSKNKPPPLRGLHLLRRQWLGGSRPGQDCPRCTGDFWNSKMSFEKNGWFWPFFSTSQRLNKRRHLSTQSEIGIKIFLMSLLLTKVNHLWTGMETMWRSLAQCTRRHRLRWEFELFALLVQNWFQIVNC